MRKEMLFASVAGTVGACALLLSSVGHTFASYSDFKTWHASAGAGTWGPPAPPAACGPVSDYARVIYGTAGNDVLNGSNQRQIIMGLGGDDIIHGGNSGDCLVGGDGNDKLYGGNAKDVLIGGAGDDYLDGGNGKDTLDGGGDGVDVCDGGNGKDTVVNCGGS